MRALLAVLAVGVAVASSEPLDVKEAPSEPWERIVAGQLQRFPRSAAEDFYKLSHQASFGPGHLIKDVEVARRFLLSELASVEADESEPLVESLGEELVRINLRPFKAAAGDPEKLLAALVTSANTVRGDAASMRARLSACQRVLEASDRESEAAHLRELARELAEKGFPAIHHSAAYREAYRPAYRVVLRSLVSALGIASER